MKCPLLGAGQLTGLDISPNQLADCLKGECAWWNKDFEDCAILSIAEWVRALDRVLADIKDRLPPKKEI